MSTREQAKLRRLELENEELRQANARHIDVYREQLVELIELRAKLQLMQELLGVRHG
jgi:hypothetical protein